MKRVAIARRLGKAQARQALKQDRQRGHQFEPRQRRADAKMDAGAETHMRIGAAPAVERVGMGKTKRIAIGGAEQEADLLALSEA